MTNLLEDRERAAEWAFAHEGEMRFLTHCTAVRGLAAHAAALMDLKLSVAEVYASDLVAAVVNGVRDEVIVERVRADLEARGLIETTEDLRERLGRSLARAVRDTRAAA